MWTHPPAPGDLALEAGRRRGEGSERRRAPTRRASAYERRDR